MATITRFRALDLPLCLNTGSRFQIFGTGLSKATHVYFVDAASKTIPALSFKIISDTEISGKCPGFSAPGRAEVRVSVEAIAAKTEPKNILASDTGESSVMVPSKFEYVNQFDVEAAPSPSGRS